MGLNHASIPFVNETDQSEYQSLIKSVDGLTPSQFEVFLKSVPKQQIPRLIHFFVAFSFDENNKKLFMQSEHPFSLANVYSPNATFAKKMKDDVNAKDPLGNTASMLYCIDYGATKSFAGLETLQEMGADFSLPLPDGTSQIVTAANKCAFGTVIFLVEKLSAENEEVQKAFDILSSQKGVPDAVFELLKKHLTT